MLDIVMLQVELGKVIEGVIRKKEEWELIGSRTYSWKGSQVLRCKRWDKVAVRWHLSTCTTDRECSGGSNVDLAETPQKFSELPVWRNAFTYAQLPTEKESFLRLGLNGYDRRKVFVKAFSPLKIDVDWQWIVGRDGCNNFTVRMSAMSTINEKSRAKLGEFCRLFDMDGFVDCDNL
ncbi:unnamed protein product [Caenorhabditis auriculariae]|uniref:Uncharacterized protein n=1 Tax=Caenorhabditis auriculariae TaxID=2777116 RepID=A0A8S1GYI2_9PELO|nr:unnamed protein product [Caenorhabditis auriculariae]